MATGEGCISRLHAFMYEAVGGDGRQEEVLGMTTNDNKQSNHNQNGNVSYLIIFLLPLFLCTAKGRSHELLESRVRG